jgi:hypothetical protein
MVPPPETPVDRAIREEGERLRRAFPSLDERRAVPIAWRAARRPQNEHGIAMVKKFCAAAALLVAVTACVGSSDDPGAYPGDYEQLIKAYLHDNLKDPYSVRDLSIGKPEKTNTWTGLLYSASFSHGGLV